MRSRQPKVYRQLPTRDSLFRNDQENGQVRPPTSLGRFTETDHLTDVRQGVSFFLNVP